MSITNPQNKSPANISTFPVEFFRNRAVKKTWIKFNTWCSPVETVTTVLVSSWGVQWCSAFREAIPPFLCESPSPEGGRRVFLVFLDLIFLREDLFSYCTIRNAREHVLPTHNSGMTVLAVSGYTVKNTKAWLLILPSPLLMFYRCKNIERIQTLTSQESAMK